MRATVSKVMSLLFVVALLFGSIPGVFASKGGIADSEAMLFSGGDGTWETPYEIATADQLNEVRNHLLFKYFKLVADIDLDSIDNWEPLGTMGKSFSGNIDGNGFKISNLKINKTDADYVGLFGSANGANFMNMKLVNVRVEGSDNVGGLVGYSNGSAIKDSSVTGNVAGKSTVGGLAGYIRGRDISNSYALGSVNGVRHVGGLVGHSEGCSINNSYATGSVDGQGNVGGLIGYKDTGLTSNSYATGSVDGHSNVGGLIGNSNIYVSSQISNSYAAVTVTGHTTYGEVGGLIGSGGGTKDNSYYLEGFTLPTDNRFGKEISEAEMKDRDTYSAWDFEHTWGIGTHNDGYPFLQAFQSQVSYEGNKNTGGVPPIDNNHYYPGETATVQGKLGDFVREGHTFAGWSGSPDGGGESYEADGTFNILGYTTLYAKWTINSYNVTFDSNGEGTVADPTILTADYEKSLGMLPTAPIRTGYTFVGWNTDESGNGEAFDTDTMVIDHLTVYAKWLSNNALLSYLATIPDELTPQFSPTHLKYELNVENTVNSIDLSFKIEDPLATVSVSKAVYESVTDSVYLYHLPNLEIGPNVIVVTVTSQDKTTNPYEVTVNRAPSGGSDSDHDNPPAPSSSPSDNKVISSNGHLKLLAGQAGEVGLDGAITITIPAGATNKEMILTIEEVLDTEGLLTNGEVLAGPVFELLKSLPSNFITPVTLTFVFDPTLLSNDQTVGIFYYDEVNKAWVAVTEVRTDGNKAKTDENHIAGDVDHFTKFAVLVVDQETGLPVTSAKTPEEAHFGDISGHWAESFIKQSASIGIVVGYPDGTFKPNDAITRAEFTVMVMNALQSNEVGGAVLTFTDTAAIDTWAQMAVSQAVQLDIVKGYEDHSFRSDAAILRSEMAMMIANALGLSVEADAITPFADNDGIPAWAKGAVFALHNVGIIKGQGNNRYAPHAKLTRAEATTILLRMLEHQENT